MTEDNIMLQNPGKNEEVHVVADSTGFRLMTMYVRNDRDSKTWSVEETIAILNDGMKYRLMKKAKMIEAAMKGD